MLIKSKEDKGLNGQQIQSIYTNYINLIDGNNERSEGTVIRWISESLKNGLLGTHFETIVASQNEKRKFELLNLFFKLEKKELVEDILFNMLRSIGCFDVERIFNEIESKNISKEIVVKSLKILLKDIECKDSNFECLIEYISKLNYLDNVTHNLIAEKIKNILAVNNNDGILFSLGVLDRLNISDTRKLSAIKTLVQDINENGFANEDLKFVRKMKEKYK